MSQTVNTVADLKRLAPLAETYAFEPGKAYIIFMPSKELADLIHSINDMEFREDIDIQFIASDAPPYIQEK